jgi:hypothetical protein
VTSSLDKNIIVSGDAFGLINIYNNPARKGVKPDILRYIKLAYSYV